jgi:hypothetical protein
MRKTKSFNASLFESGYGRAFAKGIGLISAGMTYVFCNQNGSTLIGCVLDGVLYGDTSMLVGITQISSEVPHKFDLYQNYPNPFNPTTSIRFSIPSLVRRGEGVVVLKVYDVLGSEIQTLVNENLSPGTYEVEWVGSKFASGVYYYTLSADDYKETKKMVLMK